jgi:ADP-ribosylglycohydrolase
MKNPLPDENCYWVEPGRLLAGEYPGAKEEDEARRKLKRYITCGVTFFLDLTREDELIPYSHLLSDPALSCDKRTIHCRMPIRDVDVPQSPSEMVAILDVVENALKDGHVVYVHCLGGVGRTGTVIGCYLTRKGLSGAEALRELSDMWRGVAKSKRKPLSPETREQREFVRNWAEAGRAPRIAGKDPVGALQRFRGCLLGLAIGDAVGTTLEFKAPGTFKPLTDMVGGGPFDLKAGQWTDDTSMALCLAASLIERGQFDPRDQMQRYVKWWREGYMSSTGRCFDIGNTTSEALRTFERTGNPFAGPTDLGKAGNGSLMRLAPVPMFYFKSPGEAIERAGESSRTTHGAQTAVDACRYFSGLLVGALGGVDKETLLSPRYCPVPGYWSEHPLHPEVLAVAEGSYKRKEPPQIRGTGYVVASLEAALWVFERASSFQEAILMAVNLGDDADTTGAVCGQLAGAFYGLGGLPKKWCDLLSERERLLEYSQALFDGGLP